MARWYAREAVGLMASRSFVPSLQALCRNNFRNNFFSCNIESLIRPAMIEGEALENGSRSVVVTEEDIAELEEQHLKFVKHVQDLPLTYELKAYLCGYEQEPHWGTWQHMIEEASRCPYSEGLCG